MSYQFYLVLHFVGIFMILISLGGVSLHIINGGSREFSARKWASMFHGIGLLLALVAGFGLLARLGIHPIPFWVYVKMGVWLALGAMPALIYRKKELAKVWWGLILCLGLLATIMAVYKPGLGNAETAAPNTSLADPALATPEQSTNLEAAPPSTESKSTNPQ